MGTVTGLTAARMLAIEAASIIGGAVVGNDLILTKHDGSTIDAGNVRGPAGPAGPAGPGLSDLARDSIGAFIQEGIISGGVVTRIDAITVRVSAGSAWIQGDNISGFGNGLYPVSWPQTDITGIPAESGVAQRLDQFILQLTGTPFAGTCSVSRLAGVSQGAGGVNIGNRNGAAALPNGSMRLSDLIVDSTGVPVFTANNARDRRPWARGAQYVYHVNGAADYVVTSTSWGDIDNANLSPRLEISGTGLVEVELDATIYAGGDVWLGFDMPAESNGGSSAWYTGSSTKNMPGGVDDFGAKKVLRQVIQAALGSQRFNLRGAAYNAGVNLTIKRASGYPLTFRVRENIVPSGNNGMG